MKYAAAGCVSAANFADSPMKTPSRHDGRKYLNTLPTTMSADYGLMLRRWLGGQRRA